VEVVFEITATDGDVMDFIAEISRHDPLLAESLFRLLNEIELAKNERSSRS
jgi:hypothetical protein